MRVSLILQNSSGGYASKKLEDHWTPVQDNTYGGIQHNRNWEENEYIFATRMQVD